MKRYISAILIPCLLMQFTGCYSWRVVETPEQGSHIKIFINNNKIIESKNWRYEDGKFIGDMGEEKLEGYKAVKVETTVERKEINKIEEEYYDAGATSILIGGFLLLVVTCVIIIQNSIQNSI